MFSLLSNFRAFIRLVLATEDEAIVWSSWGFSFSVLKLLCLCFLEDFSGLDFLACFGVGASPTAGVKFEANELLVGELNNFLELLAAGVISSSSLPKGSSLASRSVS